MEKFLVKGGKKLKGEVELGGAKNVALKALVAACLTEEEVVIENVPLISDFYVMAQIIDHLGGEINISDHKAIIKVTEFKKDKISLDEAALIRTSSMYIAPLLARKKSAIIPNPGGCRIGARPIDRTVEGLKKMGVKMVYNSADGYFHAKTKGMKGVSYKFEKNTHTGTETLIMAAVLAKGKTILENAAEEPEIDELINLLNKMGAKIKRIQPRTIQIVGVKKLKGVSFKIPLDRNEIATFAVAAILTGGDVFIKDARKEGLEEFIEKIKLTGCGFEEKSNGLRFYDSGKILATDVITRPFPGFMTDWQGPWAVLMTKGEGSSIIQETVYENRFGYADELAKMGAKIKLFNPVVKNPGEFYNFNIKDDKKEYRHAAKISGPVTLHDAALNISDLRAGATLVLAALSAKGESVIFGVEHLDRGYERFDEKLRSLGADIKRADGE